MLWQFAAVTREEEQDQRAVSQKNYPVERWGKAETSEANAQMARQGEIPSQMIKYTGECV